MRWPPRHCHYLRVPRLLTSLTQSALALTYLSPSFNTGEIPATRGSAFLGGHDVSKEPEAIHRLVGYCPQFDALFDTLTGREHLRLYAAIKVRTLGVLAVVAVSIESSNLACNRFDAECTR